LDTSANLENAPGPPPAGQEALPPIWLQRAQVFVYVLFCFVLGMYLVLLPWWYHWFADGLVEQWPALQRALQHGFVRGAVSGLGLVDIWMGISEAVNYHDRR
jgi:hypothetical protein